MRFPVTIFSSNGDGPVITIKLIPADSRLEGLPACSLPIIVKNQNNTQVLLKNIEYYVVQKPVTRNGCPSCPGTGDKHTVQIEATLYRYCIDCVKPQNGVSTPYPLKSQRVFGNICTSKDSSCGWGVTLDCISYGRIQDIWDCTYPDGQENTGVSDSCYNKCAHLEYGPDPLNLTPFAGWWEHNKKEVCGTLNESCGDSPTDCCSTNSQNSINSNINAVPDNFLIRNKAIELGYEGFIVTGKHTNIQTYKHTNIQTYKHTNIQTYKHTNIQTYTQTHKHTYIHTYIQTYKHTNIQTYKHTCIS